MVPVGQFPCASAQTSPARQQLSIQHTGSAFSHQSIFELAGQQVASVGAQEPNSLSSAAVGPQHLVLAGHDPPPCLTVQQVNDAGLQLFLVAALGSAALSQHCGYCDGQHPWPHVTGRSPLQRFFFLPFFFFFASA